LYIGIGIILLLRRTSFSKRQNFSIQQFSTNSHATSFWNNSHRECAIIISVRCVITSTIRILAKDDRSNLFLVSSTNRSSCTIHDDTYRQHKHNKNHLTMAQLPPTVYPAAFGHNSISKWPVNTKFEERVAHKACNDLVKYGRHRQLNRYLIPLTTIMDRLILSALK
jgi:hypothetical protein